MVHEPLANDSSLRTLIIDKSLPTAANNILPEVTESFGEMKDRHRKQRADPQILVKMNSRSQGEPQRVLVKGEVEGLKFYLSYKK